MKYTKGFEKGKVEGKTEELHIIAENMLADGESIDKIKKWTGLSVDQINALKK